MKSPLSKIVFVLALAFLQSCSTTSPIKKIAKNKSYGMEKFGNFDKVYVPNEAPIIAQMISIVQPELDHNIRNQVALDISRAITKFSVEPQIMVALIDTESNFQYSKVSTTGDLSIAQVNVDVWNKEFTRLKMPMIKKKDLVKKDQQYAMNVMAQILKILKARHGKSDRRWYARYHSNTTKYKMDYLRKIEIRMKMLSQAHSIVINIASK